jgi:hypothetical protein
MRIWIARINEDSMIINALDLGWTFVGPSKAEAVLIVHSDRMLFGTISDKGLEAVTGRGSR